MASLYIVPTPIGNLKDMTYRAVEVLQTVDLILCEDTRTSSKLLKHYNIAKPLMAYHQHNEHKISSSLIQRLLGGERMALISDAGTPGISDPGFYLIRAAINESIAIECLPGATAFVPALVKSGFASEKFVYEGFLPLKKGRHTKLTELAEEKRTVIIYESPHRLLKCLEQIKSYFGDERPIAVSRELSKIHEETIRGTATEVFNYYKENTIKGEIVIVISGKN